MRYTRVSVRNWSQQVSYLARLVKDSSIVVDSNGLLHASILYSCSSVLCSKTNVQHKCGREEAGRRCNV